MSNLFYMDDSNGNGIFATTISDNLTNSLSTTISNLMTSNANDSNAAAAAATALSNLPTSQSNEDLSQSLSEYTDAEESSISAPTEFLAEFLSAVMLKDYNKALKYCKLILQYEPNNLTAKEFYPLIVDKLHAKGTSSESDENCNKSSSPELVASLDYLHAPAMDDEPSGDGSYLDGFSDNIDAGNGSNNESSSNSEHRSCDAIVSESLEDDGEDESEIMSASSSEDDLPMDESNLFDGLDRSSKGTSNSSRNSASGAEGGRSDNTTHSYSSLLLEEEDDDIVPANIQFSKNRSAHDLDLSNGNKVASTSCSDSESPTEPLTQRLAAILRSKCGV